VHTCKSTIGVQWRDRSLQVKGSKPCHNFCSERRCGDLPAETQTTAPPGDCRCSPVCDAVSGIAQEQTDENHLRIQTTVLDTSNTTNCSLRLIQTGHLAAIMVGALWCTRDILHCPSESLITSQNKGINALRVGSITRGYIQHKELTTGCLYIVPTSILPICTSH
jgi:hypothetical protein